MVTQGDRVKYADSHFIPTYDSLRTCSSPNMREAILNGIKRDKAKRGVVTRQWHNGYCEAADVTWDGGAIASCMACILTVAKD